MIPGPDDSTQELAPYYSNKIKQSKIKLKRTKDFPIHLINSNNVGIKEC